MNEADVGQDEECMQVVKVNQKHGVVAWALQIQAAVLKGHGPAVDRTG